MNIITFLMGAKISPVRPGKGLQAPSEDLPKLQQYYRQHIQPKASKYERLRIKSLKQCRTRVALFVLTLVVTLLLVWHYWYDLMYYSSLGPEASFALALTPVLLMFFWCKKPIKAFQTQVKKDLFPLIFRYFGDDFTFSPNDGLPLRPFRDAGILPKHDIAHSSDFITGSYKQVELGISELVLKSEYRDSKNKKRTSEVFKGLAMTFTVPQNFGCHAVLIRDRGLLGKLSSSYSGLKQMKLEDPVFEKEFDVFADNQINGRVLMNPLFMERLLDLSKKFGRDLRCAFHGRQLLILFPSNKDRFETASIFEGATFEKEFSQIHSEMQQLFAIIDMLKLETRTGYQA